ncbi:hypothetical protein NE237_017547 [Protea cynaroides]|uniref:Uncharacterized protein n=1 Tax=Protea cynaroides TaxID=273540 RepID=A0A9Q0QN50_9MAGN|nr:hypothetical protein NE237_017547 [Protea cynaroides]
MKAASLRPIPGSPAALSGHDIVPRGGHYNGLSRLTRYVTYCVRTGERISLPYLIIRTMHRPAVAGRAGNLPYGRSSLSFFAVAGVSLGGEVAVGDTMTSDIGPGCDTRRMRMVDLPVSDGELEARPRPLGRVAAAAAAAAANRGLCGRDGG